LAESTFDGNGIKAITLPLKDVSIDEIFNVMSKRLGEAVTSEIQSFDDTIELKKGKKITIPDSISMKIGMKLSLMGIVLITLKAKEIVEIEARAKEEIVEKVYEERSTKMKDMLEVEEKESKKKRKSKPKKKVEKVPEEILTQPKASRSVAAGAGPPSPTSIPSPPPTTGAPAGPPPTSASPPPPPSVVASESAPPPSPVPSAPTAAPKPVVKPQPSVMPPPLKAEVEELEPEPAEMAEDMDVMAFDDADEVDDMLIAKGMEKTDHTMTLRYTHTSYFSRMLLNRAYPLIVKISMEEVGVQKSITSVMSGERISEREESIEVSEEDPNVTIRPEFPGCFVVPNEYVVDIREEKIEVKFHVTPLALGTLDGSVKFIQSGKSIHAMALETRVITHRISKWLAGIGASTSAIPFMMALFLDETIPQFMEKRLDGFAPSLKDYGGIIIGLITAVFLFLSGFVYRLQRPRKSSSSLAFPR
jgi:hypothetical protein